MKTKMGLRFSKVIVFDGIKINKKNMDCIKEYLSLSRNRNCCCIYLCQGYYDVPKYVRRNTKCFCLFPSIDNRDAMNIATDHAQGISKEEFKRIYNKATSEPYDLGAWIKLLSTHLKGIGETLTGCM